MNWTGSALCAQTDPDIFFPEEGHTPHMALKVCQRCPLQTRLDCLEDAVAWEAEYGGSTLYGVRGGLTPNKRKPLVLARRLGS